VRGGPPNGEGEIANPRSLPRPTQQQIWLIDTVAAATGGAATDGAGAATRPAATGHAATGPAAPRLVAEGSEPQFSPDGRSLLWLTARGIAMAALPADRAGAWAVSKPAEATDSDPSWSADGRRVAFRREFGHQPDTEIGFTEPFVAKQPWSLWVADPTAREAHQIWRADPGVGSAYYDLDQDATDAGSQGDQLLWSKDGQIAFAWEHDGWRHLYAVSAEGGEARLLTPGNGEVESAAVSLDRSQLIYATNIGDLERRHLALVSFGGSAPIQLTSGSTSQWAPTPVAAGGIAYIEAGWAKPPAVVWQNSARRVAVAGPAAPTFPTAKLVRPQPVSFQGTDGGTAYGQLFVPAAPSGCGVVFVHGGIKRQMLLGFHYMDAYSNLYELNQYFVSRGCAVLSVEYRSSIMRGYAFRNAPGWGTAGASEYLDVLGGAQYLKSRTDLRVKNIGIYGLSWGGYLTAQALARNSDVFQVGFDMAGVHSFPRDAFKYSPVAFAEQWRSPVYLAAGDDDRNVDFNQTILLIQALRGNQQKVEIVEKALPNEIHDMALTFEHLTDLYWEGSEFMLHHLQ
jgi:dipeptidyl aminopeptidase/acylaminoacyl peptidase